MEEIEIMTNKELIEKLSLYPAEAPVELFGDEGKRIGEPVDVLCEPRNVIHPNGFVIVQVE